jgi:C-3',4' desaturase CrtD
VQVVEHHTLPGGCASFYQKAGYRFDVGATLVGGFGARGVHTAIFRALALDVRATAVEPAMLVHLPDRVVARYGDERWRPERRRAFGDGPEAFWHAQEAIADRAWPFSARFPALPSDPAGAFALAGAFRAAQLPLAVTLGRTIGAIMPRDATPAFRAFVDAQLLITAQADAATADLAYGATALDLAREGVYHLPDGVSTIAVALAHAVRREGSEIAYGTDAVRILTRRGAVAGVVTADGTTIACDRVIAAIPAESVLALLAAGGAPAAAPALARRTAAHPQRWGAFMAYVGLPEGVVPDDLALHHQLVADAEAPPGEGNTTFLSFSEAGSRRRARDGGRAVTISTHTDVARWERAHARGRTAEERAALGARLLAALDRVVPGASARARLVEFADPHTFARYTARPRGLVGGTPQTPATANLRALSHTSGVRGLVLAGDTVFPGQSTVGASLSGAVAARAVGTRVAL